MIFFGCSCHDRMRRPKIPNLKLQWVENVNIIHIKNRHRKKTDRKERRKLLHWKIITGIKLWRNIDSIADDIFGKTFAASLKIRFYIAEKGFFHHLPFYRVAMIRKMSALILSLTLVFKWQFDFVSEFTFSKSKKIKK